MPSYERFVSDDRQMVQYQNSEAAIAHLVKFAVTFGERCATMVDRKRLRVRKSER